MTNLVQNNTVFPQENTDFDIYKTDSKAGNIGLYLAKAQSSDQPIVSINGNSSFYPASVCKLFYLACFYDKVQKQELEADDEDWRAINNMVTQSSNDATGYILNRLCGTETGAKLDDSRLMPWLEKRKAIQRWLAANYPHIPQEQYHLYHSTFDESPYGREKQARERLGGNLVSPFACAQMMASIFEEKTFQLQFQTQMKQLLSKNNGENRFAADGVDQVSNFIGGGLPDNAKYWSKAGWTSTVKHETAYVTLNEQASYVISIFTRGETLAQDKQLFSDLARRLIASINN
ncbi:serine hydrolase [Vibrio hannami]|uniref:serine hydrolase n=1 Tax=Vibrio hannami TaxID=2717094 RepID=UPI00240F6628|nr:serine hydrolase [Vibrio hannami]MDG3087486.1 serine hydrolase [Vibrio hannami]